MTEGIELSTAASQLLNLTFEGISQTVRCGILKTEKRQLLKDVNGDFRAGELTAIIGPSGAGKSTLMDILAGFMSPTTGSVSVNGNPRDVTAFRRSSTYIMQNDNLEPLLTVNECMHVAADLKLASSTDEKKQRIDQILRSMGLEDCRPTRTGDLSGGQRKRLAIALELVNNPPVMFFDEPTSGLDNVTSKHCITLLKKLAREGPRTIIVTIHQPSATLFDMVDHLYVIDDGVCVYSGGTKTLVPYLANIGLQCPTHYNPADFIIEICNGDYGDHKKKLAESIQNGRSNDWRSVSNMKLDSSVSHGLCLKLPKLNSTEREKQDPRQYATGFFSQFGVLCKRNVIKLSRDKTLTFMRLSVHCIIGLLVGTLYYGIGQDASHVLNNFNFLFYNVMFLMYTAFSSMIITYPLAMPVIMREHFNRWYKLRSFYLANKLADLPIQITSVSLYLLIVYFMTGQIREIERFALMIAAYISISLVAQMIGVCVGTAMNIRNGVIFGPLFIMPFVVFSGFFVHVNDAPPFLHWLFHVSFIKHGFEGVIASIYGFDRPRLDCKEPLFCYFEHPKKLLMELNMKNVEYWFSLLFLVSLYFALDLVAYVILRLKLKKIL